MEQNVIKSVVVVQVTPQERVQYRMMQSVDVVDVPTPQGGDEGPRRRAWTKVWRSRCHRTSRKSWKLRRLRHRLILVVTVPQNLEEIVEVTQSTPQERAELILVVTVPQNLREIVEVVHSTHHKIACSTVRWCRKSTSPWNRSSWS